MSIALLDVNVLIALFDDKHQHHEQAHTWFGRNRKQGWATCSITINGCVRILSSPAYVDVKVTTVDMMKDLRALCATERHHFWYDDVSILEPGVVHPHLVTSHRQITDIHLLALAVRHSGRLATFDRSIPLKAAVGARPANLEIIGG